MPYIDVNLSPGVFKDDTALVAEGYYIDSDKIRFVRGKPQTVAGWELASATQVLGICRGLNSWKDNTGLGWAGIGTHNALEAFFDGNIYDITPIVTRGQLTNPFTTSNGTSTTVAHNAHGRAVGDRVNFANATAVGGIVISGDYTVVTIATNSYTITTAVAVAAGPGGGTVDYSYYLATGLIDTLGGAGYGTGGWGIGPFGTASNTVYYARTWSLDNWGQNELASPRGGGIYEWSPFVTQVELVTNGNFESGSAPWSYGSGWSWTGSAASGGGSVASDLSQTIIMTGSAYFELEADVTVTSGTVQPKIGATLIGSAVSVTSHIKSTFFTGLSPLTFSKDGSFSGRLDNISVKQLTNGSLLPNAPLVNTVMLVTPERIVMVGGTVDIQTNIFNPLQVRWSDQDFNVAAGLPGNQIWTPTATNQSGFYTLAKGGRIVGMKNGNSEVLVWTDDALYAARYVPDPNVVYSFRLVGQGCGLIGANAAIVAGGIAYWMAPTGEFYRYAGGVPEPLQSTCRRDVFDNLAKVQGDKVYAFSNSAWTEVWWLYPDMRDGNECSRYIIYDIAENVWAPGTFIRTAWLDAGAIPYSLATDTSKNLYYQEKGTSADGGVFSWSLTTGKIQIGDGNNLLQVNNFIPDAKDLQGGFTLTFDTYLYPYSSAVTVGPYNVNTSTDKVDMIFIAREVVRKLEGNAAPAFWREGLPRFDIMNTGQLY